MDGHRDRGVQRDGEGYRGAGSIGHSSGSTQQQRPVNRAAGAGAGAGAGTGGGFGGGSGAGGMGAAGGGRGVVRPGDGRGSVGRGSVGGRGGVGAVGVGGRGGGGGGVGGSGRIGIGDIVRRDGDGRRLDGRDKADRGGHGAYGMSGRGGGYDDRPVKNPQPGSAPPHRTQPPPMLWVDGYVLPCPHGDAIFRYGKVPRDGDGGLCWRNHRENHMGPAYDSDDDDNMEVGFSQLMAEERRR
ncbi:unnamed protein product [Closterium sp. NIES-64]|nr:unnamed protein product [Closterium sp. NIES-64]